MRVLRREPIVSFKRPVLCVLLKIHLAVKLSLTADTIKGFVFYKSQILIQPCSSLGWSFISSWVPQSSTTWPSQRAVLVGSPRLWYALSCQCYTQIPSWPHGMTGIHGPVILLKAHCYFGCVCSFHVLGKAAGQEQPDCPEMFANPTALLFPCQKTLPERGQQKNAIDILLMKHGRAGVA